MNNKKVDWKKILDESEPLEIPLRQIRRSFSENSTNFLKKTMGYTEHEKDNARRYAREYYHKHKKVKRK